MNKPTDKQLKAFYNMQRALRWNTPAPETNEQASKMISRMKEEIDTRLRITGQIAPRVESTWYDEGYFGLTDY